MIILSLIIPNYNGLYFLEFCINSVIEQLHDKIEIIIIDDGSTDSSVNFICDNYSELLKSNRIKLICTENFGPGHARNVGVQNSLGTYISFLDSDDYLLPNYFNKILDTIFHFQPDIIQYNELRVFGNNFNRSFKLLSHNCKEGHYKIEEVINEIFGISKWFPHSRVFKKSLLLENPFPNHKIFYEDLSTIPFIFFKIKNIYLIGDPMLAYRDNPNSITRNHKPDEVYVISSILDSAINLPTSVARNLFIINISRTLLHFIVEFNIKSFSIIEILNNVNILPNKLTLIRYLNFPEIFFLIFPRFYFLLKYFIIRP